MKKTHLLLSLPLALGAMSVCSGVAHADLLTYYNFNDAVSGDATANAASRVSDTPPAGTQTTSITTNFADANVVNFAGTLNNRATGDTTAAGQAIAFQGGSTANPTLNNGSYFQFAFSATGQANIGLSYSSQRTTTGFTSQVITYSTDGGTTFNSFSNNTNSAIPTAFATFSTGPITAIDGAANVIFRFTLDGATAAAGNNRFDNIQVNSNVMATPEPETWAMMALGLGALAMFTWKRKKSDGDVAYGSGFAL